MLARYFAALLDFNSRPCARGDTHAAVYFCDHVYFNSRPCARGDSKFEQFLSSQFMRTSQLKGGLPAFLQHVMGKTLL